jgi:glucosylceramidase
MKAFIFYLSIFIMLILFACSSKQNKLSVEVYETSESGNKLTKISKFIVTENIATIKLDLKEKVFL